MKNSTHTLNRETRPSSFPFPPSAFRSPPSAFTLVELLVVVTIISMLAALVLPAVMAAESVPGLPSAGIISINSSWPFSSTTLAKQHLPGYINRQGVSRCRSP